LRADADFAAASDAELLEIQQVCGGNPLASRLVIGQAATLSLAQVLRALSTARRGSAGADLYHYIYWHSWELLTDAARLLLVRLPLLPPTGGQWDDLAGISSLDENGLEAAVAELVNCSLLQAGGGLSKTYAIHPLTRHFVMSEIVRG
jgi:hypothetical protein